MAPGGGAAPFVYVNPNPAQSVVATSGFTTANRINAGASADPAVSGPNADTANWSLWWVGEPPSVQSILNYALIGKSNSVTSTAQGWNLTATTGRLRLRIVTSSGAQDSPECGLAGFENGGLAVIHGVVSSGVMRMYKNGVLQDGSTTIAGTVVNSNFGMTIGSYSSGNPYGGSWAAAGVAGALSDAQVESHYQALIADVAAQPTGAVHQWLAEDLSGGTLTAALGGVNLSETGTVTQTTESLALNHRFDPADAALSAAVSPLIANTAGLLDCMLVGDSITNCVGSASGAGFVDGIATLAAGSGDFANLALVGPNTTTAAGELHNGNSGWTIGDHLDGDGTPAAAIAAQLATHSPDIVSILLGANNAVAGNDALAAAGMADYLTLCRAIGDTGARIVCMPPTIKDSGALNAQVDALAAFIINQAVPTLRAEGYDVTTCNTRVLTQATDFFDGTHPNDTGYALLDDVIYAGIRRASGRT